MKENIFLSNYFVVQLQATYSIVLKIYKFKICKFKLNYLIRKNIYRILFNSFKKYLTLLNLL